MKIHVHKYAVLQIGGKQRADFTSSLLTTFLVKAGEPMDFCFLFFKASGSSDHSNYNQFKGLNMAAKYLH